ncbi:MAG: hypothetical protein ACLS7Z_03420 [Christensenellales bacterium]
MAGSPPGRPAHGADALGVLLVVIFGVGNELRRAGVYLFQF